MFKRIPRKELERQNARLRAKIIDMMTKILDYEGIALDAQFVLENNRITAYREIAEDIIDRIDELQLPLLACDPDDEA